MRRVRSILGRHAEILQILQHVGYEAEVGQPISVEVISTAVHTIWMQRRLILANINTELIHAIISDAALLRALATVVPLAMARIFLTAMSCVWFVALAGFATETRHHHIRNNNSAKTRARRKG